jgi:hypothetical protein
MVRIDEQLAVILTQNCAPGFYNLCIAVRVYDDKGVEVLGIAPPAVLPVDDVTALLNLEATANKSEI